MEYTSENHNPQILKIGRKNRSMHPKAVQVKYNFLLSKGNNIGHHLVILSHQSGRELLPLVAMVTYLDVPKAVQVKYNFLLSKGNNIGHHFVILSHQSGRELLASTNGS